MAALAAAQAERDARQKDLDALEDPLQENCVAVQAGKPAGGTSGGGKHSAGKAGLSHTGSSVDGLVLAAWA